MFDALHPRSHNVHCHSPCFLMTRHRSFQLSTFQGCPQPYKDNSCQKSPSRTLGVVHAWVVVWYRMYLKHIYLRPPARPLELSPSPRAKCPTSSSRGIWQCGICHCQTAVYTHKITLYDHIPARDWPEGARAPGSDVSWGRCVKTTVMCHTPNSYKVRVIVSYTSCKLFTAAGKTYWNKT